MQGTLQGIGVSHGVAIGEVRHMGAVVLEPPARRIVEGDAQREQARAHRALQAVAADLLARGNLAGGEAQQVLTAQALMADDPELRADVDRRIAVGSTAERAVYDVFAAYRSLLAGAGEYLAGRVADVDDVRNRIVARLLGVPMPGVPDSDEPFVLVARDLAPADTALLDPSLVLGFVTSEGGPTSHSAILARALGVPAVVALPGADGIPEGTTLGVDGSTGQVFVEPTAGERERMTREAAARRAALAGATGPATTSDGHRVPLLANIAGPGDLEAAVAAGAEGVGLLRTEFLFLGGAPAGSSGGGALPLPSQAAQAAAYREVLAAFPAGRVVVRVLDAGADKPLRFLTSGGEPNPALGVRGLRALLAHPEVLHTQLAALAEAAEGLPVHLDVMAPMVTDRTDARAFAEACAAAGLRARTGAMVEVPAAALRARSLLREVEFLSLGTNDLAQYTFAADRQLASVARHQDPWGPALLDLVALACEAARAEGRDCGVCGEAASDSLLACVLTGLGVTSLSMSPASLPFVRTMLGRFTLGQCARAAAAARAADTAEGAREAARAVLSGE